MKKVANATFAWKEYTASDDSGVPTNLNFGSTNARDLTPLNHPIMVDSRSFSKVITGDFTSVNEKILNVKFWKSAGEYVTGESVKFKTTDTYEDPTTDDIVGTDVPTSEPANNVGIGGSTSGELTADGETDYIVLQKHIADTAGPGVTNTLTFTLQYDEI